MITSSHVFHEPSVRPFDGSTDNYTNPFLLKIKTLRKRLAPLLDPPVLDILGYLLVPISTMAVILCPIFRLGILDKTP